MVCLLFIATDLSANSDSTKPLSLGWITFSDVTKDHWRSEIDPNDAGIMYLTPEWPSAAKQSHKKVFMLLPKKSVSYQLALTEFLDVMSTNNLATHITLIHFNEDTARGQQALNRAEAEKADLIFSIGSESASLVHEHFLGKDIPVVTCTNKDPVQLGMVSDYESGSGTNIAYTSLNVPIDVQVDYLTTLKPELKVVGLLYNKNHKQVMATEVMPIKKKFSTMGFELVDIAVTSRATAKQELIERMPDAMGEIANIDPELKNSLLLITSSTAAFAQIETINQFAGNVPVLGSIPNVVKEAQDSAVLAIGIDRRNNGHLASIYALQILTGKVRAGELKVGVVTPPDIAINFNVAKRIGLKIPFQFFESASFIYNYEGHPARMFGQRVQQ